MSSQKVVGAEGRDGGAALGAGLDGSGTVAGVTAAAAEEVNVIQGDVFYCHHCHQPRTGERTPACKGGSKKKRKCRLRYCKRCVDNRYEWIAEEKLNEETWECPKCRNRCDCSNCRRKRGQSPTGRMVRPAKNPKSSVDDTPANKKPLLGAENPDAPEDDIDLPTGTLVTCVAGVELQPEDVGAAIQFLEFCRLFGEIFEIREGQPEQTVKDITGGRQLREVTSVVADLHINLLSIIEKGKAKACEYPRHGDEWIKKVGEYIADSTLDTKDLILNSLNQGASGYKKLTPSCKLSVLNYLCDEAFSAEWERRDSVATEKVCAATKKEKELKERYKYLTKPMEGGETTSNEEAENIISQIKEANAVKRAAMNEQEELGRVLKTMPIRVEKGVAYWKLDGYCNNNTNIMRQEFDDENALKNKDKWFMFNEDEEKVIEDHLERFRRPSRNHNWV